MESLLSLAIYNTKDSLVFPSSFSVCVRARKNRYTYKAGVGAVISGWDEGCLGMRLGEQRRLYIPSSEAYGSHGFPAWHIPPNSALRYDVQVIAIEPE